MSKHPSVDKGRSISANSLLKKSADALERHSRERGNPDLPHASGPPLSRG